MAGEPTLGAFLEGLSGEDASPGGAAAAAFAGAAGAALVMMVARVGLRAGDDDRLRTVLEQADAARRSLEQLLGQEEGGAGALDDLLAHAEQASAILDLAIQAITHRHAGTPAAHATLPTAVALARAATEGLTQSVRAQLDAIGDNLTRTAYKTRISGLVGRVRRAEADFVAAAITAGGG